ncbi:hypothetical protein ACF0H5_009638 [Mactra antiquata]
MESSQSQLTQTLELIKQRKTTPDTVKIDGDNLTMAILKRISTDNCIRVELTDEALKQIDENCKYLDDIIDNNNGVFIYGLNTGFGGSADVRANNASEIQDALLRLLNVGFGRTFAPGSVKSAMVVRVNSLSKAYSGVSSSFAQSLADVINSNIVPAVPIRGSISASGDLIPLSYVAATLIGREDLKVYHNGQETTCPVALSKAGITPAKMLRRDGLAMVNGTSFTVGVAAPLLYDTNIACLLAQACTGLAVEGLNGTTESFHHVIQDCLPHIGQREVARNLRQILSGSKLAKHSLDINKMESLSTHRLKQDRYSLRSASQWLGPVIETMREANRKLEIELRGVSDNPIIDHRTKSILNGANFQGETLSLTLDHIRQSIGVCGKILFAQFSELVNVNLNFDLPPNLSGCDFHTDFGYKGADIAMAAYMSELGHVVNPMSNHVLSAEMHNQSVNSLALISYRLTADALEIFQMMLANHINMVVQAVDLRHLQFTVTEKLQKLKEQYKQHPVFNGNHHWYEFIFCRDRMVETMLSMNGTKLNGVEMVAMNELNGIYVDMKEGKANVADSLGLGTRRLYKFVRESLGIPFYCGQCPMDGWLQKIFTAIQDGRIDDVITDVFAERNDFC